jgi:6-phosphogluconate dehydrogenase
MIGGTNEIVQSLDPIFKTLAPGKGDITVTPGRSEQQGTADQGLFALRTGRFRSFRKNDS